MECEKFWLEHPASLFSNFDILPERSMCANAKLNAATRLVLIISIVLLFSKINDWYMFLLAGISLVLFLKYAVCGQRENFTELPLQPLNPILVHSQTTPIESIDAINDTECGDYEMLGEDGGDSTPINDVEYVDEQYKPKRYFGYSNLMPHEEEVPEGMDRKQLQYLNTNRYAERMCEARDATTFFIRKEMQERFEPDEYYESY